MYFLHTTHTIAKGDYLIKDQHHTVLFGLIPQYREKVQGCWNHSHRAQYRLNNDCRQIVCMLIDQRPG